VLTRSSKKTARIAVLTLVVGVAFAACTRSGAASPSASGMMEPSPSASGMMEPSPSASGMMEPSPSASGMMEPSPSASTP